MTTWDLSDTMVKGVVTEEDGGFIEVDQPDTIEEGVYVLEKKYWVHLKNDDFSRWLWRLCDWTGEPVKVYHGGVLLQRRGAWH